VGYALTLIVGIEFVGANDGIGRLIWQSYEVYAIDRMVAALIAVALIGWLATVALDEAEYLLVPWQATSVRIRETRMQHYARTWWRAMRPWSYTAAIVPVLLGSGIAAAAGTVDPWLLLLTLIGSVAIQGGTNLVNDYYDYQKGTDQPGSIGTGDALLQGALTPRQVLIGGIAAFGVGASIGLYLVSVSGPLILWIGIISVAVGFFYTAGPFALAYHGLGELAVFIFMGPIIVVGAYYVQRRDAPLGVILAALPVGLLVAAILHANNLRDLDGDRRSGKRTLATILGREGARIELYALLISAYVALAALVAAGIAPWPTLLGLVTLPVAVRLMRIAAAESEPSRLQPIVPLAARLHLQTGVLMVIGWLLPLVLPRT
jgi:1,4-dihydroxy-2-naphthoate octaprenyltransferase